MKITHDPATDTIKIAMQLSDLHTMQANGLDLWLTPGSTQPYWAAHASFRYDKVIATPLDFLAARGLDSFDEDADYADFDEILSIEVKR